MLGVIFQEPLFINCIPTLCKFYYIIRCKGALCSQLTKIKTKVLGFLLSLFGSFWHLSGASLGEDSVLVKGPSLQIHQSVGILSCYIDQVAAVGEPVLNRLKTFLLCRKKPACWSL